ncbi:WH1-domain-containing protein, partial [Wolfiporia cocos MD-104 SS10]
MPSTSTLNNDEKSKVKAAIPTASNKIHTAALARIYYAHPQPSEWSYAGLQGALALVHDKSKNSLFMRMVDLAGTRGVIWQHELYEGFEYFQDRPFFHSFAGDKCMIGVVFADEGEAKTFHKKVTTTKPGTEKPKASSSKKKTAKRGKIDKSMISGPTSGSFKHVAHMGYDSNSGFTSSNVDPSWSAFLKELEGRGISQDMLQENMEFIKDFVRDAQKAPPAPAAPASGGKKRPPPPPASRRHGHQDSVSAPTPPPAPPAP